jgi:hypothetical protein
MVGTRRKGARTPPADLGAIPASTPAATASGSAPAATGIPPPSKKGKASAKHPAKSSKKKTPPKASPKKAAKSTDLTISQGDLDAMIASAVAAAQANLPPRAVSVSSTRSMRINSPHQGRKRSPSRAPYPIPGKSGRQRQRSRSRSPRRRKRSRSRSRSRSRNRGRGHGHGRSGRSRSHRRRSRSSSRSASSSSSEDDAAPVENAWNVIPEESEFEEKKAAKFSKKDPMRFPTLFWRGDFPPPANMPTPGGSADKFAG